MSKRRYNNRWTGNKEAQQQADAAYHQMLDSIVKCKLCRAVKSNIVKIRIKRHKGRKVPMCGKCHNDIVQAKRKQPKFQPWTFHRTPVNQLTKTINADRLDQCLKQHNELDLWLESFGITLNIKNNGQHWVFLDGSRQIAQWWPSTATFMIDPDQHAKYQAFDCKQTVELIEKIVNRAGVRP
jgi:hypothetical protein